MEWVETTGRTLEEAKEAALDQLGVDEVDAEFEVLEEPRAGLFGRVRGEARVRARVRPTAPRPKEDRRDRRRRGRAAGESTAGSGAGSGSGSATLESDEDVSGSDSAADARSQGSGPDDGDAGSGGPADRPAARKRRRSRGSGTGDGPAGQAVESSGPAAGAGAEPGSGRAGRGGAAARSREGSQGHPDNGRGDMSVDVPLDEQGRVAEGFLMGLLGEFGLEARVKVTTSPEEEVRLDLTGSELGLLIGPKGSTLLALQDLTRTAVHHQTKAGNGRIFVDVGAYRQKRSEALARFAQQVAGQVKESGAPTALEPMTAPDRKVVHDALTDIDGVSTVSEGEEPRRRVVIVPSSADA